MPSKTSGKSQSAPKKHFSLAVFRDPKIRFASVAGFFIFVFLILNLAIPHVAITGLGPSITYSSDNNDYSVSVDTTYSAQKIADATKDATAENTEDQETTTDSQKTSEQTSTNTTPTTGATNNSTTNGTTTNSSNANTTTNSNTNTNSTPSSRTTDPMSGILVAEAENVSFDRKSYQPSWDVGTGCNIRARILQTTSIIEYQTSNGCTVTYGSWYDAYTGNTLTGNPYQGDGTANDLDIDHIIPLNYVNSHGGYYWSSSQKRSYGSSLSGLENGLYIAVSASENRKKSDKGPSEYYPPNPDYRCEYATKWRNIARTYQISLSSADYNVIKDVLISCGVN